jgi:predicted XRE-type DNA-binding protein
MLARGLNSHLILAFGFPWRPWRPSRLTIGRKDLATSVSARRSIFQHLGADHPHECLNNLRYGTGPKAIQATDAETKAIMNERLKIKRGSGNVFQDIGFGPEEAENLKLRANLMMRIEDHYRKSGATQAAAAKTLGLTTPRFNALLKGKIGLFGLDALVNIAVRAGLRIELRIKKAA